MWDGDIAMVEKDVYHSITRKRVNTIRQSQGCVQEEANCIKCSQCSLNEGH